MRTLVVTSLAVTSLTALALSLAWPSTDAEAQGRQVRSYGSCQQLAENRGWTRNTRGERQFIRRCMQGRQT
jgi:hypothetical protein